MPPTPLTEADEGKRIVTSDGTELGMLVEVREGTPYVDTDPDVVEKIEAELDWEDPDEDAYPMKTADVEEVTHDEVRLR